MLPLAACGESEAESEGSPLVIPLDVTPELRAKSEAWASKTELLTPESELVGAGVRVASEVVDFGTVYSGAVLDHTFVLEAIGTEDLVIERIKPGCGCTVATPSVILEDGTRRPYVLKEPLAPGTKLELLCRFDTAGKRGLQAKPIHVYCNDPRGRQLLTLRAKLENFLTVAPNSVQLGRFSILESRTAEVTLATRGAGPVKLSVDPLRIPAEMKIELTPDKPAADGRANLWKAVVTLGGDMLRSGPYQYMLPINSDVPNPKAPDNARLEQEWLGGTILVLADVIDVYTYSPRQLLFGPVSKEATVSRTLTFTSFDEEYPLADLAISFVGKSGDELANAERYSVRVEPGNGKGTWKIELLIDGLPEGSGLFEGAVRIATHNPDRPHIDVPFSGVVR
ncbi:MAG: hypothetical protein ACI8TQ_002210 [Planctomycetota bacterium]|jgi:hypothetical protein